MYKDSISNKVTQDFSTYLLGGTIPLYEEKEGIIKDASLFSSVNAWGIVVHGIEVTAGWRKQLGNQVFYLEQVKLQMTLRHPGGDAKLGQTSLEVSEGYLDGKPYVGGTVAC